MFDTNEESDDNEDEILQCTQPTEYVCKKCEITQDFHQMQLGFYTEEEFYDCSFLVGKDDDIEIFKCHKLVLAAQSQVFAKMLFGSFSEAHQSRDKPIAFNDCTPSTFDLAMRFIYGNVQEFSTIPVACDVYKFAHKWQFQNLKQAAMNTLRESKPDEVLMVYEMHELLGDDEEKNHWKQFIIKNTSEVLSSPSWIHASSSTVDEIFKEPVLKVTSERELFDALVRWGKENSDSASNLRLKIDSALKEIRFMTFSAKAFAELLKSNPEIFKDETINEEKFLILYCISIEDPSDLPPGFNKLCYERKERFHVQFYNFHLDDTEYESSDVQVNCDSPRSRTLFQLDTEQVYLESINLDCFIMEENKGREANLICSVTEHKSGKQVAVVKFKGLIDNDLEGLDFPRPVLLKKNKSYAISVEYLNRDPLCSRIYSYKHGSQLFWDVNKRVTLKILDSHVNLSKIIFFAFRS